MAKTLLHSVSAASTNGNTIATGAIDTASGPANLIIVNVASLSTNPATFSDSKSNTWTALTLQSVTAGVQTRLYYCVNPITDAAHTFQANGTGMYASLEVEAWQFDDTPTFEAQTGASNGTTPFATGALTPADDDALFIIGMGSFDGGGTAAGGVGTAGFVVVTEYCNQ